MRLSRPLAALSVLFLNGCDSAPAAPEVEVESAWIRLPAVTGRPGAAYFTLRANSEGMTLGNVSSPAIGRIELHDSAMEGGMMAMGPLTDRRLPADGALAFAPGGKHAMLFDIAPHVRAGETVPLTFTFAPAPPATVEATVVGAGDPAPE